MSGEACFPFETGWFNKPLFYQPRSTPGSSGPFRPKLNTKLIEAGVPDPGNSVLTPETLTCRSTFVNTELAFILQALQGRLLESRQVISKVKQVICFKAALRRTGPVQAIAAW